ncbi:MAG: DNA-directed RNA polymerase subunit alpha [Patescibacteria group bacterium]
MEKLLLPSKIEWQKGENKNQKSVVIEPCYFGYGTTLGNALRRVLLSSLPGAAVTAVKIKGAEHEFSTLPGVLEDVVEIILNLKRLRINLHSDDPVKITLKAKGEKEVTGADFDKNSEVEIVNPSMIIANLTDKKAELEMEVTVAKGRGYIPTEAQDKSKLNVGEIAVDALFSPVVSAGFRVENTRVGQITNYDKLTLHIETDGSITPEEAFDQSVKILIDHVNILQGVGVVEEKTEKKEELADDPETTPKTKKEEKKEEKK